jgi:phage terminase small subunit
MKKARLRRAARSDPTGNRTRVFAVRGRCPWPLGGRLAAEIGYENLRKPQIAAAISGAFKARAERTRVDQDRVVLELARNGFSDMREIASWGEDGITYKASGELTDEAAATVAEITETVTSTKDGGERRTRTVKLHSKLRALERLGRHLGIFTDKVQMAPPPDGFTIRLKGLPEKPRGPAIR